MPDQPVSVIGTNNFKPTPEQIRRVQSFLKWSAYGKKPDTIVFVHPKDFPATAHAFNASTRQALTHAGRTYINAALLTNKDVTGKNNLEWALAHEMAHLNSPDVPAIQEKQDQIYDDEADDMIRQWNGKRGQGYRTVQSQIDKLPGQFQPAESQPSSLLSTDSLLPHAAILGALGAASQPVQTKPSNLLLGYK